jgi:hypothetical protein
MWAKCPRYDRVMSFLANCGTHKYSYLFPALYCEVPLCEPCWPLHEKRCATAQAAILAGMMAAAMEMGIREAADERETEEAEQMSEGEGGEEDELEDVFLEDDGEMEDRNIEEMGDEDETAREEAEEEGRGEMEEDNGDEDFCGKCEESRILYNLTLLGMREVN